MAGPPQIEVRVLRVFCGNGGRHGNALGVVLDGSSVSADDRQAFAARLGYSETVFVDDRDTGRIAIYTPEVEYPFAGHPTVGTAWLLAREGHDVDALRPSAGTVPARIDGEAAYVSGRVEWCPQFDLIQLEDAGAIDAHPGIERGDGLVGPAPGERARPRDRGPPGSRIGHPRTAAGRRDGGDRREGGGGVTFGVPPVGLEPTTPGLKVRCSNQLSYGGTLSLEVQQPVGIERVRT